MALTATPCNNVHVPLPLDTQHVYTGLHTSDRHILQMPLARKRENEAAKAWLAQLPPSAPYTPFFVPDILLGQTQHNLQKQSPLFKLPTELLLLIVDKVHVPYFQVVLGLTCKSLASLLSSNRDILTPWRGFRDKEGLYRLLTREPNVSQIHRCSSSVSSVGVDNNNTGVGPINISLPLQPYISTKLRLCKACFRHVPRSKSYWLSRMCSTDFDKPHVNWFDILNFFSENQRNCGQHKCPECCVRNYVCFMSEREYEKALEEDRMEEDEYLIDLGTDGRRVCAALSNRLARP